MSGVPVLAFALALGAGVALWLLPLPLRLLRAAALAVCLALLALAVALVRATAGGEVLVHAFGDWAAPFGIVFVTDRLAALMSLLLALVLAVTVGLLRPASHGEATVRRALPLLLVLAAGLLGAFNTGDLFNLFVFFELVLLASYLLLQVPGGDRSLAAAFPNVAINLVASLFFFVGVGVLYGACGTVNLADLALRIEAVPPALRLAALGLLATAFAVKAGVVPLVFWLPATYPTLSGPVAALFAGMMTKLGVYALLRTAPLLMQGTPLPQLLVVAGAASALLGVMAALSQYEVRRLLGFHIVSQVGYMVLGLGLMTVAGIAGAVFYLTHHILVKAALYFVADELERRHGSRDLREMAPAAAGAGLSGLLFCLAAFSLAGLPPFSGFPAKLGLFHATWGAGAYASLAVLVVASFYTLASMLKIWQLAFQRSPDRPTSGAPATPARRLVPLLALTALSLTLSLAAGPVWSFAEATAAQLLDAHGYAAAVLGGGAEAALSVGGAP